MCAHLLITFLQALSEPCMGTVSAPFILFILGVASFKPYYKDRAKGRD